MNCGPGHIQSNYSSTYSGFNIQQNIAPLLLYICWQFREHYTATSVWIQRTAFSLRSVNCGPGHIHCKYSSAYSGFNIQQNIAPLLLYICWQFREHYTATSVSIQRTAFSLRSVNCGPGHIHCKYSSAYSGFNIQLNVSRPLLEICREYNAPYTANIVQSTAHILQITVFEWWSRPYTV
jgi:hypothetical protein